MANEFDKKTAREIATQVEEELKAFGERRGLKIQYAGGTLDGARFTMKLSFDLAGVDKDAEDFKKHASMVGLKAEDLGKEITVTGRRFVIVGLKTSGRGSQSAPVIAKDILRGENYLLKVGQVKLALGREVSEWEKDL